MDSLLVQGNLADNRTSPPRTLQQPYAWGNTVVVLGGGAVSYAESHMVVLVGDRFPCTTQSGRIPLIGYPHNPESRRLGMAAVKRIWYIYDSQGQILNSASR